MKVENGSVEGAVRFAIGDAIVSDAIDKTKPAPRATADMCRVQLRLSPVAGSNIKVEVWLPKQWNRKLMGLGGGGFDGSLGPNGTDALGKAVGQGYATVATDVGHTPTPSLETWVHDQPEKLVDFGHRGNHLAAVVAKQVVVAYYGRPANKSYFVGCSNGGRDAIMEASRYPTDYDGVVAGAPAVHYLAVVTQLVWYSRAVGAPGLAAGLNGKLGLVHDAILKKCDALDGVTDGVLENPRQCRFDPAELACKSGDGAACLTQPQVTALQKIYGGARLGDGELVIDPPSPGSEGAAGNWEAWVTGPVPAIAGQEFYRWMVYDKPGWKIDEFDLDRDYRAARARLGPIINADNQDLAAFTRRGGKLIVYQGWDDPAITPNSTIRFFEEAKRRIGPRLSNQLRLFMVPGMMHCGGGPGATTFDMQRALEDWMERGKAPDRVLALKSDGGAPKPTHPLCAWPATARYLGKGSPRDAANYVCTKPR
jgi:feruloyl esterase